MWVCGIRMCKTSVNLCSQNTQCKVMKQQCQSITYIVGKSLHQNKLYGTFRTCGTSSWRLRRLPLARTDNWAGRCGCESKAKAGCAVLAAGGTGTHHPAPCRPGRSGPPARTQIGHSWPRWCTRAREIQGCGHAVGKMSLGTVLQTNGGWSSIGKPECLILCLSIYKYIFVFQAASLHPPKNLFTCYIFCTFRSS